MAAYSFSRWSLRAVYSEKSNMKIEIHCLGFPGFRVLWSFERHASHHVRFRIDHPKFCASCIVYPTVLATAYVTRGETLKFVRVVPSVVGAKAPERRFAGPAV
jgi:hypothetical protein